MTGNPEPEVDPMAEAVEQAARYLDLVEHRVIDAGIVPPGLAVPSVIARNLRTALSHLPASSGGTRVRDLEWKAVNYWPGIDGWDAEGLGLSYWVVETPNGFRAACRRDALEL